MLSDEEWLYTWEHGRQLASMYEYNNDEYGWEFTYDADGMRTKRSDGSTTYTYSYDGSRLSGMTVGTRGRFCGDKGTVLLSPGTSEGSPS